MDLLPTIAEITGAKLPERAIDGTSLVAMLTYIQSSGTAPRDTFLYYTSKGDLAGIRRGDMKLLFAGPEAKQGSLLFNVAIDISEEWNLAEREPATVANLEKLARELDAEITADARPVRHVQETLWKWPRDAAK
jgi:arylsulfatase